MNDDEERGPVDRLVLGHTCEGLREHLAAAYYGCVPRLSENGTISGCDDTNNVPIVFCPWCGTDLRQPAP